MWLDRGYPSAHVILWLQARHLRFVMRVATGFYTEIGDATESDSVVTTRIAKDRACHLKDQGTRVPVGTEMTIRVLKFVLPTEEIETLITDLTLVELPHAEAPRTTTT